MKNLFTRKITYIILGWLLIIAAVALDEGLTVPVYEIKSGKIKKPLRIVLLTDFHSSSYGKNQQVLADVIDGQKPDIILLAGDIAEDVRPHKHTEELLAQIAEKYPCFYAVGNHEEWSGECGKIKEMFRSYGVTVLEGDSHILDFDGQKIRVSGADNSLPEEQLSACANNAGDGVFTVFVSHRPDRVDEYSGKGFDLVVSGHAHGGQVRVPGLLNGLYAPDQGLFPKYAGGRYTLADGSTEMIVSRGLCKNILPRVFNPPEVVVITINN
ncbi:MAG: metallophosphoesterase [Ruminococcus sp.]|nr:metallophosphoesterase [Ruminococcus sp.]MCM1381337.1 metallophosphoesterase [Muribaculaceae bacterium]MCM1479542.1 metallophosphoesterase [Muribaculaceae bacterium]